MYRIQDDISLRLPKQAHPEGGHTWLSERNFAKIYEDPSNPIMEALPVQIGPNSKPLPQKDDLMEALKAKYNPTNDWINYKY